MPLTFGPPSLIDTEGAHNEHFVHFVVQAVAEELTGTSRGLGRAEDVDGGDAEFDHAGAGGVVGLEAMSGALGAAHGV